MNTINIIQTLAITRQSHSRHSAPSIAAFGEIGPIGERQEAARFRRARDGPSKTLAKSKTRRKQAESVWRFFWVLFFGQTKKSTSAVGPRPDIKTIRRDSDTQSTPLMPHLNNHRRPLIMNNHFFSRLFLENRRRSGS